MCLSSADTYVVASDNRSGGRLLLAVGDLDRIHDLDGEVNLVAIRNGSGRLARAEEHRLYHEPVRPRPELVEGASVDIGVVAFQQRLPEQRGGV